MSTLTFEVKPGDRVVAALDDPSALLVYDGVPDFVVAPAELGGGRVNVRHGERSACPCGDHDTLVLVLDEPTGLRVAECSARGFLWFRVRS